MPERIEKYGFIVTGLIHLIAIIWWISTLSNNVSHQDELTAVLDAKVDLITEKVIRLEEQTRSLRYKQSQMDSDFKEILARIEGRIDANHL